MSTHNRKDARAQLVALLTGTGAFQAVYEGDPKSTAGASPIAAVRDRGVRRVRLMDGTYSERFVYEVVTAVVRSGANAGTEKQIEDALADVEKAVADMVDANTILSGYWSDLAYNEQGTQTSYDVLDGLQYRGEVIPLDAAIES